MNSYPFLNNKHKPIFTSDLADIVPRVRKERVIDITNSPVVPAASLRIKLEVLHRAGELDGGLPIIRDDILVGLIPAPDLEYALDNLPDEGSSMCLMTSVPSIDDSDDGSGDVGTAASTAPVAGSAPSAASQTEPQAVAGGGLADTGAQLWPAAIGGIFVIAGFVLLRRIRRGAL